MIEFAEHFWENMAKTFPRFVVRYDFKKMAGEGWPMGYGACWVSWAACRGYACPIPFCFVIRAWQILYARMLNWLVQRDMIEVSLLFFLEHSQDCEVVFFEPEHSITVNCHDGQWRFEPRKG